MGYHKLPQQIMGVTFLVLLLVGCGTPTATPMPPTSTPIHTPVLPLSVTVTKDLVYAKRLQPDAQVEWKLDLYTPTEPGDWPVVVFLPYTGTPGQGEATFPRAIAEQGAIVFNIEWPRINPTEAILDKGKGYHEMAETVACAIRFARARASDYGMDTAPVVITGFSISAGAASHVALAGETVGRRWEEYAASRGGPPRQVDCEVSQGSTHVDALVGIAGAYDGFVGYDGKWGREFMQEKDPDLWKMLYGCIGENPDLKVRLLHSETDSTIPYENSVEFEATLAEAGYDVELTQFGGGHIAPLELTVQTIMSVARD
jgi:acetyl esterase/lipase